MVFGKTELFGDIADNTKIDETKHHRNSKRKANGKIKNYGISGNKY